MLNQHGGGLRLPLPSVGGCADCGVNSDPISSGGEVGGVCRVNEGASFKMVVSLCVVAVKQVAEGQQVGGG